MDFLVITGLALLFLLISWAYGRVLSAGKPLNTVKKQILVWAFIFVLGLGYIMVAVADLDLRHDLLFELIGIWIVTVGLVGWWRFRYRPQKIRIPKSD